MVRSNPTAKRVQAAFSDDRWAASAAWYARHERRATFRVRYTTTSGPSSAGGGPQSMVTTTGRQPHDGR